MDRDIDDTASGDRTAVAEMGEALLLVNLSYARNTAIITAELELIIRRSIIRQPTKTLEGVHSRTTTITAEKINSNARYELRKRNLVLLF